MKTRQSIEQMLMALPNLTIDPDDGKVLVSDECRANKRIAEISRQIWGTAYTDYL